MTKQENEKKIKKFILIILSAYILLSMVFYYLAGDQLRYQSSSYNIDMPAAQTAITELRADTVVEQTFTTKIEEVKTVSVLWGTYYRTNAGTVTMELKDTVKGETMASASFNAADIADGGTTELTLDGATIDGEPADGETADGVTADGVSAAHASHPLVLRLTSDSEPGNAVAPMGVSNSRQGFSLSVNGQEVPGNLCMSVTGVEPVLLGHHYWLTVIAGGLILAAVLLICFRRWQRSGSNLLISILLAMEHYRFLISQLVQRDFKIKYKRSFLGILWSFLNPLFTMSVQYVVFSRLFRFDIVNYPVYLLAGIVMYSFFTESCGMIMMSVTGNSALIKKVYVPKYIYPLTRVMSSLINLSISMIPLFMVALISGIRITKAWLLVVYPLVCVAVFCLGLGMMLATFMVFFQDTQFLWGVLSMIWMYLTPIFYPPSILPEQMKWVIKVNPLYHYVDFLRTCIITGISPEPRAYVSCLLGSLIMLAIGGLIFMKNQDRFILYL